METVQPLLERFFNSFNDWKTIIMVMMIFWAVYECVENERRHSIDKIWNDPAFLLFMCVGNLVLLTWLWGLSLHIWKSYRIEFSILLTIEGSALITENSSPELVVYSAASDATLVFLATFVAYTRAIREGYSSNQNVGRYGASIAHAHSIPLLLLGIFLYKAVNPWHHKKLWFSMLSQVLLAPLYPITFRDGYIGDLLTSLVRVTVPLLSALIHSVMTIYAWLFNDFSFLASRNTTPWWEKTDFFRYYLVPLLTLYPLWVRLLQCLRRSVETGKNFPHHLNALKYASAIAVISCGTFQPTLRQSSVWITTLVFATLFQLVWDIAMDWGLVTIHRPSRWNSRGRYAWPSVSLRSIRLMFNSSTGVYVIALVFNCIFRFAWTLTVLPYPFDDAGDADVSPRRSLLQALFAHAGPLVASAEIMRRMVWGWFRVEWEHIEVLGQPNNIDSSASHIISGGGEKERAMPRAFDADISFEKMEIAGSEDSVETDVWTWPWLPSLGSAWGADSSRGWLWMDAVDLVVVPPVVKEAMKVYSLDLDAGGLSERRNRKARLIESVLMAGTVVLIVMIAAA